MSSHGHCFPDVLLTLFLVDAIGLVVTIEFGECPTTNIGIGQAMTVIEYKGHRIEVSPVGKGWRAVIFAPGSTRALADSPSNLEKSRTEEIVAEAKRIIDARFCPRSV